MFKFHLFLLQCWLKQTRNKHNALNENLSFEKLRIVDLLSGLIKKNVKVNSILIDNGWLEFDTINDYELYSNMLNENKISQLIKLNY